MNQQQLAKALGPIPNNIDDVMKHLLKLWNAPKTYNLLWSAEITTHSLVNDFTYDIFGHEVYAKEADVWFIMGVDQNGYECILFETRDLSEPEWKTSWVLYSDGSNVLMRSDEHIDEIGFLCYLVWHKRQENKLAA